jgi:hypothetical protein
MWLVSSSEDGASTFIAQSSKVEAVDQPDNVCELPVEVRVAGKTLPSYTTFLRTCAYGVVLDTRIVGPGLRVHLHSDYLGDPDGTARSSHYSDAPDCIPGHTGWDSSEHSRAELDVRWKPSGCLYHHLHRLLDLLEQLGRQARIDVSDEVLRPFQAVEEGRSVAAGAPRHRPLSTAAASTLYSWCTLGLDLPGLPRAGTTPNPGRARRLR